MSLPFGSDATTFDRFLQELPADFRELAVEFKAFCRPRTIKTPEQRLRVVMSDCGLDAVLREVAGDFARLEERISDTAIHRRLQACGPWVKAVLGRMRGEAAQPPRAGRLRFPIVDGTTVQSPGATGTEYRRHVTIDWVNLRLVQGVVTDEPVGEHLNHAPRQDGDGVVLDRGDNPVGLWIDQADRGVSRVVRDNPHGLPLYEVEGEDPLNIARTLRERTAPEFCRPVHVRDPRRKAGLAGYLHGRPLPPAPAPAARRRVRAAAKKKGRQPQLRTLALAAWVLIWTTRPPSVLPTATILALYRVRWQIELVIKRLKSILHLDQLRARKDGLLADLDLHGQLLDVWVVEKQLRQRGGHDAQRLDQPRQATPWRAWKLRHRELAAAISGVREGDRRRWTAALDVMRERPRRRALQTVPERIRRPIADCQAHGLSNI